MKVMVGVYVGVMVGVKVGVGAAALYSPMTANPEMEFVCENDVSAPALKPSSRLPLAMSNWYTLVPLDPQNDPPLGSRLTLIQKSSPGIS